MAVVIVHETLGILLGTNGLAPMWSLKSEPNTPEVTGAITFPSKSVAEHYVQYESKLAVKDNLEYVDVFNDLEKGASVIQLRKAGLQDKLGDIELNYLKLVEPHGHA